MEAHVHPRPGKFKVGAMPLWHHCFCAGGRGSGGLSRPAYQHLAPEVGVHVTKPLSVSPHPHPHSFSHLSSFNVRPVSSLSSLQHMIIYGSASLALSPRSNNSGWGAAWTRPGHHRLKGLLQSTGLLGLTVFFLNPKI